MRLRILLAAITAATATALTAEAACPTPEGTETRSGSQTLPGEVHLEGSASEDSSCLSLAMDMRERLRFELDHQEAEDGPTGRQAVRVDMVQGSGIDWDMDAVYDTLPADGGVFTLEQSLGLEDLRLAGAWSSREEDEGSERSWRTSAEADLLEGPDFGLTAQTEYEATSVTDDPEQTTSAGVSSRLGRTELALNQSQTRRDGLTVETLNSAETSLRLEGLLRHLERLSLGASRLTAEDTIEDTYRLSLDTSEDGALAFTYLAEDADPGWEVSGSVPIPLASGLPLRLDAATSWRAAGPAARFELRSEFDF